MAIPIPVGEVEAPRRASRPSPSWRSRAAATRTWCQRTAALVGPAREAVIGEFMRDNAIHHLRSAQGALAQRDKQDVSPS